MAQIVINIPDAQVNAALNAACYALDYQAQIEQPPGTMIPNPEGKAAFVKRRLGEHLKALIERGAQEQAAAQARTTALAGVAGIPIT